MKSLRTNVFLLAAVILLGSASLAFAGVVINEVDYDQPGADEGEFIELYNCGVETVDLTGWTLELVNGNGDTIYDTVALSGSLAGNAYLVICFGLNADASCDISVGGGAVQNGAPDAMGLRDGTGALVDALSYEGDAAAPYVEGSGAGLSDSNSAAGSIARVPNGADTDVNNVDFVFGAATPGAANGQDNPDCFEVIPVETPSWGTVKGLYQD